MVGVRTKQHKTVGSVWNIEIKYRHLSLVFTVRRTAINDDIFFDRESAVWGLACGSKQL